MDEQIIGAATGGVVGTAVGGLPGALAFGAIGALVGDAYSKKPVVEHHAANVRNDLAPEMVSLDGHQIYVRITTGHGRESLLAAMETAIGLSNNFARRADQMTAARSASNEAWQGGASTAAAAATTPLSDSFAAARSQLAVNSQALHAELVAFDHIRSQVELVPATPPQSGVGNAVNPFQTDVDAAINEYNAKAARNVALYEAYSAETAAARSQVPQSYVEPIPLGASATGITRTASPIGATAIAPPQVGSVAEVGQPAATSASATPGETPSHPAPSPGSAQGGTAGQGGVATDPASRQVPSTTTPAPGGVPGMPAARDTRASGPLAGPPRPAGQRNQAGSGPRAGGASGIGGGPRTGAGASSGAGPGLRGGSSVGNGPVPGQIPPGQGQPVGRGGAGTPARGAAGTGGMPMGPASRGNVDDDQEHRRKYLIQPDEKELFGTDEPYVPPVIGDRR